MPKYLVHANYSTEGLEGLLKTGGAARAEAVQKAVSPRGDRSSREAERRLRTARQLTRHAASRSPTDIP